MTRLTTTRPVPFRRPGEAGYTLVAVMFLLFLFTLSLSVAVPRVIRQLRRDQELETMQRGKQYIRAIRVYYRKFNAYPPNLDALVKTQNIRFLRKKYKDPITGKDDWKAIAPGQNKAPLVMGFFGQPLNGASIAGVGASGGNTTTGTTSATSSFFSSSTSTSPTATTGQSSTTATSSDSSSSSSTDSNFGSSGGTFGGMGIIGFSPATNKESMMTYKTKTHYNEWEFVYDPIMERLYSGSSIAGGSATTANSATSSTSSSSFSNSFSSGTSSSFTGTNSGSTSTSSTSTTP